MGTSTIISPDFCENGSGPPRGTDFDAVAQPRGLELELLLHGCYRHHPLVCIPQVLPRFLRLHGSRLEHENARDDLQGLCHISWFYLLLLSSSPAKRFRCLGLAAIENGFYLLSVTMPANRARVPTPV